jgi:predicted dehydrogenase
MPAALQAAAAGCHLFVEKPLSDRWEGVDSLAALVERRRIVALVGYQLRFHPCLRQLREWLVEARVGPIVSVRVEVGEYLPGWHPYEDYRQMYASRRDLGGGVVLSQIHELDYIQWLFGMPRRLFALGGRLGRLEIDVEDTASILMECEVEGRRFPVHLHQDFLQRPPKRTCEVIGEEGRAEIDFHALSARVVDASGRPGESRSFAGFERNQLFLDELGHFLACVRGEESPIVGIGEGARSLRMALAARESIKTGHVVELA